VASTSLAQVQAMLYIAGTTPRDCSQSRTLPVCWPEVKTPSLSLLIALSIAGGAGSAPTLTASLAGDRLTLTQTYAQSPPGGSRATDILELAAIPLSSLPKAVLTVIEPPYDQPPRDSRAVVDIRDPLPSTSTDLSTAIDELGTARDSAFKDAQSRQGAQLWVLRALGTMRWPDGSLGCSGVHSAITTPVNGYEMFVVQGGVQTSSELEYHIGAGQTVFCGLSH
jgi:hypothetical protein